MHLLTIASYLEVDGHRTELAHRTGQSMLLASRLGFQGVSEAVLDIGIKC